MAYIIIIVALVFSSYVHAVDIGSDTAVTRFNSQQVLENGDRIAGFAALDAGFLLGGDLVSGTFDSFFPVSGDIGLQFGTLILNQDLILRNATRLTANGNITGNFHTIEFSPSMDCFPVDDVVDLCSVTFTAELVKETRVNSVDWSFDSKYIVDGIDVAVGNELFVEEVINENFIVTRASAAFTQNVNGVAWHPFNDWIAVARVSGAGDELFTYTFNRVANTLTLIDSENFGGAGNDATSVAWHPDGGHLAVSRNSAGAGVKVAVYEIDGSGNIVVGGGSPVTDSFAAQANEVDWDLTGSFLAAVTVGAVGVNELRVYAFGKSPLTLTLDASISSPGDNTLNTVSWNKSAGKTNILAVGQQAGTGRLQTYRHAVGSLTLLQAVTTGAAVNSVHWHPDGRCLAVGLVVNSAESGGELRVFSFDNDVLTLEDDEETNDDVETVRWSPNGRLLAIGTEGQGAADSKVMLFRFDGDFGNFSSVTYENVQLVFNGNTQFNRPLIRFAGENVINGRGNIWSLSSTFSFMIQSNSSVLLKDVVINGLTEGKLGMVDQTSTVSFQNVELVLDGIFTFSTGHFEILKDLKISGNGQTFVYASPSTSTILSRSPQFISSQCRPGFEGALILGQGVTFHYDSLISNTLLALQDDMARIIMHNATLMATSSLQLTKGQLIIEGNSFFDSVDGIIFGDGTAANNLSVELLPAARLEVAGKLINNNV